jgi:LPXTG-motif cell wall-anchored protein
VVTEAPPVHRQLPVTGDDSASGIWLATLVCSLGALLVLTARRMAR